MILCWSTWWPVKRSIASAFAGFIVDYWANCGLLLYIRETSCCCLNIVQVFWMLSISRFCDEMSPAAAAWSRLLFLHRRSNKPLLWVYSFAAGIFNEQNRHIIIQCSVSYIHTIIRHTRSSIHQQCIVSSSWNNIHRHRSNKSLLQTRYVPSIVYWTIGYIVVVVVVVHDQQRRFFVCMYNQLLLLLFSIGNLVLLFLKYRSAGILLLLSILKSCMWIGSLLLE